MFQSLWTQQNRTTFLHVFDGEEDKICYHFEKTEKLKILEKTEITLYPEGYLLFLHQF